MKIKGTEKTLLYRITALINNDDLSQEEARKLKAGEVIDIAKGKAEHLISKGLSVMREEPPINKTSKKIKKENN